MAKSIVTNSITCEIIDLRKEYPNSLLGNEAVEVKFAVVSDLSAEELATVEELKEYIPFVVISPEMHEVIKESNRNNARERKRDFLYHDVFAIDDERATTTLLSPDTIAESNYVHNHILDEIRLLPGLQGRRLYQRYVLDLSVEEIAKMDGVSISTVYECIRKAKVAIHNVFIAEGVVA